MTALTFRGRLPGVVCQTALPPSGEEAIRLDVAAFVGFAERGPLHTPVAVEDSGQYAALFGGDLQVAREGGKPVMLRDEPGREFIFKLADQATNRTVRVYRVGTQAVVAMAEGAFLPPDAKDVRRFFDSLSLTKGR